MATSDITNPAMATSSSKKQTKNLLLTLPAELRNTIYRHVLVAEDSNTRIQLRNITQPALLASSRQIQKEAAGVFFSENPFVLTIRIPYTQGTQTPHTLRIHEIAIPAWIQTVETTTPLHIRNVQVEIDHVFKWVVGTMCVPCGGPMRVLETWLHDGRQRLPLEEMRQKVAEFVKGVTEGRTDVSDVRKAGLRYVDVVGVAGMMLPAWAGRIVPV